MRILLLALLLPTLAGSAGCAAGASATVNTSASVPITTTERHGSHEEHASQSCTQSSQCEAPLTCCFATPEGGKLSTGYCATEDICAAVSAPPP